MIVTNITQHPTKLDYFICDITTNGSIEIRPNIYVFTSNKKYQIKECFIKNYDDIPRKYKVVMEYKPKLTKNNYDSLDFMHVYKIERSEKTQIKIYLPNLTQKMDFDSSEECLNEFLQLKKMQKEALSSG